MGNNKGYSVVLVLLILGVISIMGSALMTMSQLDINFSSAIKNYDTLFNLADGACSMAFNDLKIADREEQASFTGRTAYDPLTQKETTAARLGPFYNTLSEGSYGNYAVYELLQGYDDSAKDQAGWEAGPGSGGQGYHEEFWTGEGRATRNMGSLMVEAATTKRKRN